MYKLFISLFSTIAIISSIATPVVEAAVTPDFPSCTNPTGTLRVSYEEGTHGIVGDTNQYTGKDEVYNLANGNNIQCFCSESGEGIQTNWWKASSLDQSEIDELVADGWILIPNGTDWGLDQGTYLAKNSEYACGGSTGGNTDTQILSTSTQNSVLGLADTGNLVTIYGYTILGILSLLAGLGIKKRIN